jgi:BirA family biotin operon repressor/biotin-[acetyl-CoA-carboxylase] ligase
MAKHFGSTRFHFESIESTHLHLMQRGDSLPSGTVITSDHQEGGRGRMGRRWTAPPGTSLLASFLIKPKLAADRAHELTHLLSLACAQALRERGIDALIRWPNDLTVKGKKIAGILSEASLDGTDVGFVVISAGINLNQTPGELADIDRPATSCLAESGNRWDARDVLEIIICKLDELYRAHRDRGFEAIEAPWKQLCSLTGKRIVLDLGARTVGGTVVGYADGGAMLMNTGGKLQRFSSGEVVRVEGLDHDS